MSEPRAPAASPGPALRRPGPATSIRAPVFRAAPGPPEAAPWPVCGLVLLLPVVLLHGRGIAEALIAVVAALFLLHSARRRDWGWLRTGWVQVAAAWWLWLVLCSLPAAGLGQGGTGSLVQALATVRFLVFVAALEHWVLGGARGSTAVEVSRAKTRGWLARLVAVSALYIALQSWLQLLAGRNLWGWPRWGDGSLTGPYFEPRAGAPMSRLLFPAMLPLAARRMERRQWARALLLVLAGAATVVLIGQRMPLLLTGIGLVASGLLLRRLRRVVLACLLAAGLLVPATAVLSPPAFGHLVTRFSEQMRHFPESDYGRIAVRALVIARADPWTGRGFDGYRTGCPDPSTFHGLDSRVGDGDDGGGGSPHVCVQHPHNHYLQALTDAGLPGLLLFGLLVAAWLHALGRGLWRGARGDARAYGTGRDVGRHALRVGLFVAALIQEWPIASTSSFTSMPLSGWFFLLLGLGLAEARAYMSAEEASGEPP